jgi:hypothetical protein
MGYGLLDVESGVGSAAELFAAQVNNLYFMRSV